MPGLVGPERYPIRDPENPQRVNGRNVNPVAYPEMGGFTSSSKWYAGDSEKKYTFSVEKPTSVRAIKDANTSDV